ncbi:MAG: DUF2490 domain-containing protein [Bacteroidetes bacterium]|nr:DUF2490 domain-containing protein [Bacteroidota bacterium]
MTRSITGIIFLLQLFAWSSVLYAQTDDFGLWANIQVRKDVSKKIRLAVEEEFRFYENVTRLDEAFTDFSLAYKINDYLSIAGCYRFIQDPVREGYTSKQHRFYTNINAEYDISHINIQYRIRLQTKYRDMYSDDGGLIPEDYFRNKLRIRYDLRNSRFFPFVSGELYLNLTASERKEFNKLRISAGTEYEFKNSNKAEVFIRYQKPFNIPAPERSVIIGLCYIFSLRG